MMLENTSKNFLPEQVKDTISLHTYDDDPKFETLAYNAYEKVPDYIDITVAKLLCFQDLINGERIISTQDDNDTDSQPSSLAIDFNGSIVDNDDENDGCIVDYVDYDYNEDDDYRLDSSINAKLLSLRLRHKSLIEAILYKTEILSTNKFNCIKTSLLCNCL